MRRLHLLASFVGAIMLSQGFTAANAQEAPVASTMAWQRIANASGSFSVELPCDQTEIEDRSDEGFVGISCPTGDIVFGAALMSDGLRAADPGSIFDAMVSEAKNDPDVERVEQIDLPSGKAFRMWRPATRPFGVIQISERRPGELIILAAMVDREASVDGLDRSAAKEVAFRYFASLEVSRQ